MTTKNEAEQLAAALPPCADCGGGHAATAFFEGAWAVADRHEPGCSVRAELDAPATKDEAVDLRGPGGEELRQMLEQEIAAEGLEFAEELARLLDPPAPEPPPAAE